MQTPRQLVPILLAALAACSNSGEVADTPTPQAPAGTNGAAATQCEPLETRAR